MRSQDTIAHLYDKRGFVKALSRDTCQDISVKAVTSLCLTKRHFVKHKLVTRAFMTLESCHPCVLTR